jgi:hypothetical protein
VLTVHAAKGKKAGSVKGPYSEAWSFIYVAWWQIRYHFGIKVLGPLINWTVVVLSVVEIFGPVTHISDEIIEAAGTRIPLKLILLWRSPTLHVILAIALFATACLMVFHHRFLERQTERLRSLLAFTVIMATNIRELEQTQHLEAAVQLLDGLLDALSWSGSRSSNRSRLNASILIADRPGNSFRIYAQDSEQCFGHNIPHPLIIPPNSVAGKVVDFDVEQGSTGSLVYVPSTRYVHAIIFKGAGVSFRETQISPTTYKVVDGSTERDVLKCLLCVQIPLTEAGSMPMQPEGQPPQSHPVAVLSLSSKEVNCMDSLFYLGSKLAAGLFAQVIDIV